MKTSKQDTFLACYRPVHSRFVRFCRARVYGEMDFEDLLHETLLVAYQKFDQIKDHGAFISFLCGISVKILANANRKQRPQLGMDGPFIQNVKDEAPSGEQTADVRLLYEAMAQLPVAQREALALFELSGFSIREVAQLQEVEEATVRQRLVRGRKRLAEILGATNKTRKEVAK